MKKKIFALVATVALVIGSVGHAEVNKYNEQNYINTSNATIEEVAASFDQTVDEFIKENGLPTDMPADTNEAAAYNSLTLKKWAESLGRSDEDALKELGDYIGKEVKGDMLLGDYFNELKTKDYIEDFTGLEYSEFVTIFGLGEDFDGETPYPDARNIIDRVILEQSGLLKNFNRNSVLIMIKGKYLDTNVEPRIINDRTMVPLRDIFESLGAVVNWDGETKTIFATKDNTVIVMQVGQNVIYVNGEAVEIDTPSTIVEDRTLVPVRAIANALGNTVFYNAITKTVVIH